MRAPLRLAACAAALVPVLPAHAALVENLTTSVVAMALGNAVTADPPGIDSVHFNPAGLARLEGDSTQHSAFGASIRARASFARPANFDIGGWKDDPISGTTSYYRYHPGKYLVAWHPKSSTENERSTVVTRHPVHGEVLFRQIAGALARRICTYSREGAPAVQGREFGFIKFGSRVDLYLPPDAEMKAAIGEKVYAAESVLAWLRTPSSRTR